MAKSLLLGLVLAMYFSCSVCQNISTVENTTMPYETTTVGISAKDYEEQLRNQSKRFENGLKKIIKDAVKNILPNVMNYQMDGSVSSQCMGSLLKYISALTSVKVWAIHMLDASSKPMSGIFDGTVSEYGGFDQCLDIQVPKKRRGDFELDFRGQYCAVEAALRMPPIPSNYSMARQQHAHPLDSIADELAIAGTAFHYLKFRLGLCLPSKCSLQDMQAVARRASDVTQLNVKIPQCYVKEPVVFKPIHIVMICILSVLLLTCIVGSVIDCKSKDSSSEKRKSTLQEVLTCFSFHSNLARLMSASKGSQEFKALHGMRALSMAWVLMGHTYAWVNFQLLRSPSTLVSYFHNIDFEVLHNGWMSVEPFFFLSGFLVSYSVLRLMEKTKGKINVPMYLIRRYVRLTPALLLTMGLAFFMPLVSSGPFWYERVDPELEACTKYWWTSLLYISNWSELKDICIHPTWYLSADFQLYIVAIVVLYALYKSPKVGFSLIGVLVIGCCVLIGVLTLKWNLPPIVLIGSGNNPKIHETINIVHIKTFTHVGPYFVGIVLGYLVIKYKDIKMSKLAVVSGWACSIVLGLTGVYGAHRWTIGYPHGPLLSAIFAGVHRTTFAVALAWVTFACVTGYGGPVNKILSASILAPFGRLTFMIYLLHSLVIWVRFGSLRERMMFSHYYLLYEYAGNVVFTLVLTIPVYLLLEAPVSNLERLLFSRARPPKDEATEPKTNGHLTTNSLQFAKGFDSVREPTPGANVELRGVKSLDLVQKTDEVPEAESNHCFVKGQEII